MVWRCNRHPPGRADTCLRFVALVIPQIAESAVSIAGTTIVMITGIATLMHQLGYIKFVNPK
jgi:hypothetical protein